MSYDLGIKIIGGINTMRDMTFDNIQSFYHGKMNFMAGICRKLNVSSIMESALSKSNGRRPDISYGTVAEMMIVNLCDSYKPLYRMQDYFEEKDIEGVFNTSIDMTQINDDRFGGFLDRLFEAGPRKIFSEISCQAFMTYGLTVKNVNFDTTSKVMWGEYQTPEGKGGAISIDFGHSKQKREDKRQIKMAIGTANGIIVDAKVLSGNMDDKTYNYENLDDIEGILQRTHTNKEHFYYISDSSFFTKNNLLKAKSKKIKFITRVPETTKLSKELIKTSLSEKQHAKNLIIENAHKKEVEYLIREYESTYKDIPCKLAVCYSLNLKSTKKKTIGKQVIKEEVELEKFIKPYQKRKYACEADAKKEMEEILKKQRKKLKYNTLKIHTEKQEKKKVGRPSQKESEKDYIYTLEIEIHQEYEKIQDAIEAACTFVLASNDLSISGENILREYKTQSSVEKKFQQLKAPTFMNSLFVKTPQRVEALTYMLLITMMILSVIEHVVRRELKKENEIVIGPGKIKMTRPTLRAITDIFETVPIKVIRENGFKRRIFQRELKESQKKIMRYLSLDEAIFIGSIL